MEPFKHCECGSTRFFKGPRGGAAMNVTCVSCGLGYNLLIYPATPILLINELGYTDWKPGEILDTTKHP